MSSCRSEPGPNSLSEFSKGLSSPSESESPFESSCSAVSICDDVSFSMHSSPYENLVKDPLCHLHHDIKVGIQLTLTKIVRGTLGHWNLIYLFFLCRTIFGAAGGGVKKVNPFFRSCSVAFSSVWSNLVSSLRARLHFFILNDNKDLDSDLMKWVAGVPSGKRLIVERRETRRKSDIISFIDFSCDFSSHSEIGKNKFYRFRRRIAHKILCKDGIESDVSKGLNDFGKLVFHWKGSNDYHPRHIPTERILS